MMYLVVLCFGLASGFLPNNGLGNLGGIGALGGGNGWPNFGGGTNIGQVGVVSGGLTGLNGLDQHLNKINNLLGGLGGGPVNNLGSNSGTQIGENSGNANSGTNNGNMNSGFQGDVHFNNPAGRQGHGHGIPVMCFGGSSCMGQVGAVTRGRSVDGSRNVMNGGFNSGVQNSGGNTGNINSGINTGGMNTGNQGTFTGFGGFGGMNGGFQGAMPGGMNGGFQGAMNGGMNGGFQQAAFQNSNFAAQPQFGALAGLQQQLHAMKMSGGGGGVTNTGVNTGVQNSGLNSGNINSGTNIGGMNTGLQGMVQGRSAELADEANISLGTVAASAAGVALLAATAAGIIAWRVRSKKASYETARLLPSV